jgi:hypothetical protein
VCRARPLCSLLRKVAVVPSAASPFYPVQTNPTAIDRDVMCKKLYILRFPALGMQGGCGVLEADALAVVLHSEASFELHYGVSSARI